MDDRTTETSLSLTKFGVGQPVRRSEDPKLMRGEGRYTDDLSPPGQAYAVIVRSREPHGLIRSIETVAAKAMPGVLAVYTAADLSEYGPLKCNLPLKNRDGSPIRYTPRPALAGDKVRFVRVGTLDEPDRFPPDIHIFTMSKQPWVVIPPGAHAVPEYYDRDKYWPAESLARRRAIFG